MESLPFAAAEDFFMCCSTKSKFNETVGFTNWLNFCNHSFTGLDCMYDEEGPSFFEEPPSRVDFLNEKGIQVNCSAKGRPKPMITWSNNDGTPLFDVPGLRHVAPNGALVFNPFPAESYRPDVHLGMYRCIAANSFGTIVSRDVRLRAGMS